MLNGVFAERLKPVFVEIDGQTLNATPETIHAAITERTRAMIAVHTFGRPVEIDAIRGMAGEKGIYLIEDASEALGAEFKGSKAGTFGQIGVLAFYPNKQITTGEGGMFITSDEKLAQRARHMRNQGRMRHSIGISIPRSVTATGSRILAVRSESSSCGESKIRSCEGSNWRPSTTENLRVCPT